MRSSYISALAFWHVLAGSGTLASPVKVYVRQVTSTSASLSSSSVSSDPASSVVAGDPASSVVSSDPASSVVSSDPASSDLSSAVSAVSSDTGSSAATTTAGSSTGDASAGASALTGSASVTLFQNADQKYVANAAAATDTPISGCVLATQQSTTITEAFTYSLISTVSTLVEYDTIPAGLFCNCANGWTAGTRTSYNPEGTLFVYCATGGTLASTNAISTSQPQASAKAGDPNNPDVSATTPALACTKVQHQLTLSLAVGRCNVSDDLPTTLHNCESVLMRPQVRLRLASQRRRESRSFSDVEW